jgi:hypothetical protein
MTSKAKEAIALSDVQYDASAEQDIPLTLRQSGREFTVRHQLGPLTDEAFFKYAERQEAADKTIARSQTPSTAANDPKTDLWNTLAIGVTGYKEKADFRDSVHFTHKKESIDALVTAVFPEADAEPVEEGWDIDALIPVPFHATFSGALIVNMSHSFRPESKAEMDEFLALEFNQPDKNKIASAKRLSQIERLADLGRRLLTETTGYKPGTEVPAWHLAQTVERFFLRQITQAGK